MKDRNQAVTGRSLPTIAALELPEAAEASDTEDFSVQRSTLVAQGVSRQPPPIDAAPAH